MKLNTARIRALNDELRRSLPNAHAVLTAESPLSAAKQSPESSKPSPCTTTFVTTMILIKNTTLVHSTPTAI